MLKGTLVWPSFFYPTAAAILRSCELEQVLFAVENGSCSSQHCMGDTTNPMVCN